MFKKSKINLVLIILILIISGLVVYLYKNQKELPHSFTINVVGELTSSAAQRDYKGSVTFVNDRAISGSQSYDAGGSKSDGTNEPWQKHYQCSINNGQWVSADGSMCEKSLLGGGYIEPTRDGVKNQIESGNIKPLNNCKHLDICYEIVK